MFFNNNNIIKLKNILKCKYKTKRKKKFEKQVLIYNNIN